MSDLFSIEANALTWRQGGQILRVEPWGFDGLRVRATLLESFPEVPGALLPDSKVFAQNDSQITLGEGRAELANGKLRAELTADGHLRFVQAQTGKLLFEEETPRFTRPPARWFRPRSGSESAHLEVRFFPQEDEHIYGLGQHQHGKLDQKGCVVELMQRNTEVAIPFLLSSRGYGFLWNNPALGRVELGLNGTRWVAESTRVMDYYVTAGDTPAEILRRYADVTGHAPPFPEWAAGFWQCKLRYRTQEELLEVAREYKRRGLPLAVIVVDFFHWTMMGDWQFHPEDWPDPGGMVAELDRLGVKLMVSIWPTVNPNSANYAYMAEHGMLARSDRGPAVHMTHLRDAFPPGPASLTYYDPTNPQARRFIWEQVRKNYYRHGIKVWWLDACEPEIIPMDHDNLRYHLGSALEIGAMYPLFHQQAFWDGMQQEGEEEIITLCRSAWAGSQRYGAAVWSGDISSTFEALRAQVPAGLNIGLSGIPWWTTDIGGFVGGDPRSPYFQELVVRWFQYGLFCPLFRLHGVRDPFIETETGWGSGSANEVWSFGEAAYEIIRRLLFLRERLTPYLLEQMRAAHELGLPPMRPLFLDFPDDPLCWGIEDQFTFGADLLVAPVLFEGARSRRVYLPAGAAWQDAWSGEVYPGGQWLNVDAPLERIPVFWRVGSLAAFRFDAIT